MTLFSKYRAFFCLFDGNANGRNHLVVTIKWFVYKYVCRHKLSDLICVFSLWGSFLSYFICLFVFLPLPNHPFGGSIYFIFSLLWLVHSFVLLSHFFFSFLKRSLFLFYYFLMFCFLFVFFSFYVFFSVLLFSWGFGGGGGLEEWVQDGYASG